MPGERGDLLKDLVGSVFLMNGDLTVMAAGEAIEAVYDACDAINNGIAAGMNQAGGSMEYSISGWKQPKGLHMF
jgi:hypothetical protein